MAKMLLSNMGRTGESNAGVQIVAFVSDGKVSKIVKKYCTTSLVALSYSK